MSSRNGRTATSSGRTVRAVGKLTLLIGLLTGPIVWSLHLVGSEALVSSACAPGPHGFSRFTLFGAAGWQVVLLLFTAVLALIVLVADVLAYRAWRATQIGTALTGDVGGPAGRSGWMALAGLLVSTLFLFTILLEGAPIFWLSGCM